MAAVMHRKVLEKVPATVASSAGTSTWALLLLEAQTS